VFLHGYPGIPQEFADVVHHLNGGTDVWAVALPGWGRSTQLNSCAISRVAPILAKLLLDAKDAGWERIVLVGHDLGGLVGWRVAHELPSGVLTSFVTFTPHPEVYFDVIRSFVADELPFYSLLSPLKSAYLASSDFSPMLARIENETWYDEYKQDYLRSWKQTGPRNLACYHRDNFRVVNQRAVPSEPYLYEDLHPTPHILMLGAERDALSAKRLFLQSVNKLELIRGRLLAVRIVHNASRNTVLHNFFAHEVASEMARFDWATDMHRYGLLSALKVHPILVTPDGIEDHTIELTWLYS